MPLSPDRGQPVPRRLRLAVAALIAAGYGLTLAILYPGIMTYDAKFVHEDIAKGVLGDWQSPVMTVLWGVIDPIAPHSTVMTGDCQSPSTPLAMSSYTNLAS